MEEIKDMVAQALEQKRVLSRLKAELRAHVFLAIDEQERAAGAPGLAQKTDNPQRTKLLASPNGPVVAGLVMDFLHWCGLEFTLKVLEPELGSEALAGLPRSQLAGQLGLREDLDGPLLLGLLPMGQAGRAAPAPALPAPWHEAPTKPANPPPVPAGPPAQLPARRAPAPVPAAQPPPSATAVAVVPGLGKAAAPVQASHASLDDVDVDIDDELDGAEILDDEEDYATAFARAAGSRRDTRTSSGGGGGRAAEGAGLAAAPLAKAAGIAIGGDAGSGSSSRSMELLGVDNSGPTLDAQASDELDRLQAGPSLTERPGADISMASPKRLGVLPTLSGSPGPLGPKLGPLAPLGKPGLGPLGPAGPATTSFTRRGADDIKEELRQAGLLSKGSALHEEELESENGDDESSLDLPDDSGPHAPPPDARSGAGGAAAGALRHLHGGVFDAEVSIATSASQSMEGGADVSQSHDSDWAAAARAGASQGGSRSLEMRDTGLSASDRSGELGNMPHVDYEETAEWA